MDTTNRFLKRKQIRQGIANRHGLSLVADPSLVQSILDSDVDLSSIYDFDEKFRINFDLTFNAEVTDREANELLETLKKDFDDQRYNELIASCKKDIQSSIAGPFGLGFVVSKFDKNGGNVTTLHNFEQGVTATPEDAKRYSDLQQSLKVPLNREPYNKFLKLDKNGQPVLNMKGEFQKVAFNDTKKKEMYGKMRDGESVIDGYTGKTIGTIKNKKVISEIEISLDHITSVDEIEKDPRNHLFAKGNSSEERQQDRVSIATNDKNLTLTKGPFNSSKSNLDLMEWANGTNKTDPTKTNAEFYGADSELLGKEYRKSREFLRKESIKKQIKKQGKETLITGVQEGMKMGAQQALGFVLSEFFSATFDEIQDVYKNGFAIGLADGDDQFLHVLKKRLSRIAKRLAARWKDACEAFSAGFISGFLSNLVTVIINMFIRTGARMVRIIREGFFSLLRAVKMICYPPMGMTFAEAAHEASKLIAAGLAVVGGIAIEQHVDNMIKAIPIIEPFADIITTVLVGGLTGLAVTFIVYSLGKIDLFKVNDKEKHELVMNKLETRLYRMFTEGDALISRLSLSYPLGG